MRASVTPRDLAVMFLDLAKRHGFSVTVRESVVTISRAFTPGDLASFRECDCFGPSVLDLAPLKGGSVWGTDGGSVGGYVAIKNGRYTLNKSGTAKRFITALTEALRS